MEERKTIYLCLAHMSEEGLEQKYVKEAFDTNWVVPIGPNVNAFEQNLADFANTNSDDDYDDDYAIARLGTVSFVIDGRGYIATGTRSGVTSDYWVYDPGEDLWYGDSDDDYTPLTSVHNVSSGGSSRAYAVSFSTGKRGFVLTGASGTSYFDDVYELLPYEQEDVD